VPPKLEHNACKTPPVPPKTPAGRGSAGPTWAQPCPIQMPAANRNHPPLTSYQIKPNPESPLYSFVTFRPNCKYKTALFHSPQCPQLMDHPITSKPMQPHQHRVQVNLRLFMCEYRLYRFKSVGSFNPPKSGSVAGIALSSRPAQEINLAILLS
jgi:hypothetical protein